MAAISAGIALSPARLAFGQDTKKQTPSQDFAIPYEAKLDPVFSYRKATFDPYVGGIFTARGTAGKKVELTLTSVRAPRAPKSANAALTAKARATENFTLIFSASGPLSEISSIHQLEHAALGKFSLFLVRFEDEKGQEFYEAVINHPVQ